MAIFLIPKIKIIKYPLHLYLSLIQNFSFKIYTLNKDHQVKVSSSLHIKSFLEENSKKSATKAPKLEAKEKEKRKEKRRSSKMKMCHQNKRMTTHKQNCSHKVRRRKKKKKLKKKLKRKSWMFFTNQ